MSKNLNIEDNLSLQEEFNNLPREGKLIVPMTNDYLFRAMLQKSDIILKGLVSSLLSLPMDEIDTVIIENPIILGEQIDNKTFILDVLVLLNSKKRLNIEMQVINEKNWIERSLSYMCGSFSHFSKKTRFRDNLPVHQIGILNYSLFPENPEFYANYCFLNTRSHMPYSDKLKLSVLDLTQAEIAADSDIECGLYDWARLFKAETWEEVRMIAEKNDVYKAVATQVRKLTEEERIRLQCQAREEYYKTQEYIQDLHRKEMEEVTAKLDEAEAANAEKDNLIADKDRIIAELKAQLDARSNSDK